MWDLLEAGREAEARPILDYLKAHAVQPELTCRFAWAPGSMAIWDNRCTQHRALNDYPGQRRRMHRITIGTRLRSSGGSRFSHIVLGTTPNIAPPSSPKAPVMHDLIFHSPDMSCSSIE